jgi:hypothetical protein
MMSCCPVTLLAVKPPARPLVEEFLSPLLFGFTDATSNATSVDVGIPVGACAGVNAEDIATSTRAIRTLFMADKCRSPSSAEPLGWLD